MLVLMYFAVDVRVRVRVDVRVDLWAELGRAASLGQEQLLLLGHVILVIRRAHVFLIGRRQRTRTPFVRRLAVLVGQSLACGKRAGGTLLFGLAEPEEDGAQDEHHSGGDADDDGPREAGGHRCGDGVVVGAGIYTYKNTKTQTNITEYLSIATNINSDKSLLIYSKPLGSTHTKTQKTSLNTYLTL